MSPLYAYLQMSSCAANDDNPFSGVAEVSRPVLSHVPRFQRPVVVGEMRRGREAI